MCFNSTGRTKSIFQNQLQTLTVDALPFPKELLYEAGVPSGVTFDSNYLPHYYVQPTVEKHMRVYISRNGKCYHRQFGCSEATKPIHLLLLRRNMLHANDAFHTKPESIKCLIGILSF